MLEIEAWEESKPATSLKEDPENRLHKPVRFESREVAPKNLSLKGTVVYSEKISEEGGPGEAVWVTQNTEKDYTRSSNSLFLPPMSMGNWLTAAPRSLMSRADWGYLQFKGAGNINQPNFPPRVNSKTDDIGHEVVWGVSKSEAEATINKHKMLESSGIMHAKTVKVVKLEEVPVPLPNGGVEIRSFSDAYLKPWEYADHVRRREIQRMRERLVKSHDFTLDKLRSDADVVNLFNNLEGFYQIQTEKAAPFKNDIGYMIGSPLLMDYLSGNKEFSLELQAQKIQWVVNELGRAYNIPELEASSLIDGIDLSKHIQVVREVPIEEFYGVSGVNRLTAHRPMANFHENIIADTEAKRIRHHYGLDNTEPLSQINGYTLLSEIIDRLPDRIVERYRSNLQQDRDSLIYNQVRAQSLGIGLGQSISSKDSVLGGISDYWLVGTRPKTFMNSSDDLILESLIHDQTTLSESCLALARLRGDYPENLLQQDAFIQLEVMEMQNKIMQMALEMPLDGSKIPMGSPDYKVAYVSKIAQFHRDSVLLIGKMNRLVDEQIAQGNNPWANAEFAQCAKELKKYSMFVRYVKVLQ